jgi:hypothetical protein
MAGKGLRVKFLARPPDRDRPPTFAVRQQDLHIVFWFAPRCDRISGDFST